MPVNELDDLENDPHFAAVGLFELAEHPSEGAYRVVRDPISFASSDAPTLRRHAPRVGEHTAELLGELGWSADEIATSRNLDALCGCAAAMRRIKILGEVGRRGVARPRGT